MQLLPMNYPSPDASTTSSQSAQVGRTDEEEVQKGPATKPPKAASPPAPAPPDRAVTFQVGTAGEVYIQVVDRDTGKVVREIPPEDLRQLAESMRESSGQLLDKSA